MALVLNECRQIVFANQAFRTFVGAATLDELVGCRQGEVFDCIHAEYIGKRPGESRADYDARLADLVSGFDPHWVVLAGWMRVLTMNFLGWFPGMVVNLHPALPGELPGTHAIQRAFAEHQEGRRTRTGVMVHLVPDEGVDVGPVLAFEEVAIGIDDTLDVLEARMHAVEHRLLVATLRDLCTAPHLLPHGAPA